MSLKPGWVGGAVMKFDFIHVEGWEWVRTATLTTVHKESTGENLSSEWKQKILISGHSPIRELAIRFKVSELKRWIADQLIRHNVGVNNYMGTGREDRIKIPRSEQTMEFETELMQTHNAQSFINMMNNRLCVGCVSYQTRKLAEALLEEVKKVEPELALCCVPNCIKYCGCKELFAGGCVHFNKFYTETNGDIQNIEERYRDYHEWRKKCQHR